jgi:hypothetical protein
VPRRWSDVTPAWMTEALGRPVQAVRVSDAVDGTNSRARVRVRYPDGERTVFVKRAGSVVNRLALSVLGAVAAEADIARVGMSLPLEHPAFLAAAVDRRRLAAVVVMEDVVARGARPHSALRPLDVDAVAAGLRQLASLHAAWWGVPPPAFVRPWRLGPVWAPLAWAGFAHARRTLRRLGQPLAVDTGELERGFRAWAAAASRHPRTVLHGDPHIGNSYAVDGRVGFYDWQLIRSGTWAHDVGYFVVSSLTVADRREHERDLLALYLAALGRRPAGAWELYRRTPIFGLGSWLQTLAAGSFQPRDVCLPVIERFAAAYRDGR